MSRCKISQESVGGSSSPRVPSFVDLRMNIIFQNPWTKDVLGNACERCADRIRNFMIKLHAITVRNSGLPGRKLATLSNWSVKRTTFACYEL